MKHLFITFLLCMLMGVMLGQVPQSLNYQAVARNQQGNVLTNKTIAVQITILSDNSEVYKETHTVTTNQFGLFTLQVGKGNINSGSFATINWSSGSKLMKIGMDPSSSGTYLDMGTSPLLTVPYAMIASKALTVIDQSLGNLNDVDTIGKTTGFVLGWDGTKWKPVSGAGQQGWVLNNGDLSNTNASGKVGLGVTAPKAKLHIEGTDKENIIAFKGDRYLSSRSNGTDYGVATNGEGLYMTSETGNYKQAYYFTQGNPLDTTPIFGITSKTGSSPWNPALNVSQQGMVGIGVVKPKAKLHMLDGGLLLQGNNGGVDYKGEGTALVWIPNKYGAFRTGYSLNKSWDKDSIGDVSFAAGMGNVASGRNASAFGYWTHAVGVSSTTLGAYTLALGENSIAMGNKSTAAGKFSTAMGNSTVASGETSLALGSQTTATGDLSVAMGVSSTASGPGSFASGYYTTASGNWANAFGYSTSATGFASTSFGWTTNAAGKNSASFGYFTTAKAYSSVTIGLFNDQTDNPTLDYDWNNRLFQIGNGSAYNNKNAMTVYYDGRVGLGTVNPEKNLSVAKSMNVDHLNNNSGTNEISLTFGSSSGEGIASKRTPGDGQYGLDFYTASINRLSISNAGNTTVNGNLIVRDTLKANIDYSGKAFILNGSIGTTTLAGNGTRLMWIPAKGAFRAGTANNLSWNIDSIGINSIALGSATKASADYAFASGNFTTASAQSATAMGAYTKASGAASTALGAFTQATGDYSSAFGASSKALATAATAWGNTTTASGQNATSMGANTLASGLTSTASGNNTIASGDYSFAAGYNSKATGSISFAFGSASTASGTEAIVLGNSSGASGSNAIAMGVSNYARSARSIVLGAYNDTSDTAIPTNYLDASIRIFQIGNGDFFNGRTNAMTILKSGNVGLGVTNPQNTLSIKGSMNIDQTDANNGTLAGGGLKFGNGSGEGIASKRTSGTGQFGLDFYTNFINRMSISYTGNVTIANTVSVKGNKGIIRSSDATQQKKVTANVTVSGTFAIGETKTFVFTFPEGFSIAPDAYVGNVVSGTGNAGECVMTLNNITATGGTLYVYNAKGTSITNNYIIKVIAIGAE